MDSQKCFSKKSFTYKILPFGKGTSKTNNTQAVCKDGADWQGDEHLIEIKESGFKFTLFLF